MAKTKVAVVIVARNEAKNIEKCLGSIFSQKGDWNLDVVLVDSSSDDGTPDLARKFPVTVHSIKREEFHHGRSRNLGASIGAGDFLVFLQGDAWAASETWLEELLAPFVDERIACVYGRQLPKDDCDPINKFRTEWNYQAERIEKKRGRERELAHRLYFFSTANCAIRRQVWEKFRFPEDVLIFEDATFARKVIAAGYTIMYVPQAAVIHSHNLGPQQIMKRYFDAGYVQAKYAFTQNQDRNYRAEGFDYLYHGIQNVWREAGTVWMARFIWHTMAGYLGLTWGHIMFNARRLAKRDRHSEEC
jgi:rhamnosyltransferase